MRPCRMPRRVRMVKEFQRTIINFDDRERQFYYFFRDAVNAIVDGIDKATEPVKEQP